MSTSSLSLLRHVVLLHSSPPPQCLSLQAVRAMYLLWHANVVSKSSKAPSSKAPSFSLAITTRQWWEHLFTVARSNTDATLRPPGAVSTSQVFSSSTLHKDRQPKHAPRAGNWAFSKIAEFRKLVGHEHESEPSL